MNPNLCRLALRPRGPLENFDLALRLVRTRIGPLARLAAVVLGIPWLALLMPWWWLTDPSLLAFAIFAVSGPLQAPFTVAGGELLFGESFSVREVVRNALRRSPAMLLQWVLRGLGWSAVAMLGVMLDSIEAAMAVGAFGLAAGIVVNLSTSFMSEAVFLERVPASRAIRRSAILTGGAGGSAMAATGGAVFLLGWVALAVDSLASGLFGFVLQMGAVGGSLSNGDLTPWVLLGLLLAQPLIAIYRLVLYVDARTRTEGWDLQVSFRALGMS